MRTFISDFISTLSYRGQQRAISILEEAKLEKSQVDRIALKLSDEGMYGNVQLPTETPGGVAKGSTFSGAMRDASVRMGNLYGTSNDISLMLNSSIPILTADIKALHDELTALEKSTENYSFLLSDGGSYDYAYLETFSDTRNRENFDFLIPDRAGLIFAQDEHALVLEDEGAISLPQNVIRSYPLTGRVLETNCSAFITSANELANALNVNPGTGWRMAASTFSPITSTLPSFRKLYEGFDTYPGANAVIELTLPSPSPCDSFKIAPFSDTPFELVQVKVFKDLEDTNSTNLLDAPVIIDGTRSFFFQLQPIAKMKLYIRQSQYRRNGLFPDVSEQRFRRIKREDETSPLNNINRTIDLNTEQERNTRISFISRLIQHYFHKNSPNRNKFRMSAPTSLFAPNWGIARNELLRAVSSHRNPGYAWSNQTLKSSAIEIAVLSRLPREWRDAFMPRQISQNEEGTAGNLMGVYPRDSLGPKSHMTNSINTNQDDQFKYEYNIGIQTIQVGNGISSFKGVFVSKILPSPSDVGEVKIKAEDTQYVRNLTDQDQPLVTSVEYSVSNQAKPDSESDWVPILPVNSKTVIAERFLPDALGKGLLRFPASTEENIDLFKNGYRVEDIDINQFFIRSRTRQTISGIKLPLGYASSTDIFTVNYTPAEDHSIVNFEKAGYQIPPLVSSFDANGAGEGFDGTNGQLVIDTQYDPYINYSKVDASTYNPEFGLTPYTPVVVRFEDGTIAHNLTNYKGGDQTPLSGASDYSYIQNGRSLMFNVPVDRKFRVYYQYLPNNLRFRVVLRTNTLEFVSPKVDYVQIKAKTRKADAKRK